MSWHCKVYGSYSRDSIEAQDNVDEMIAMFRTAGWVDMAIAAMLGNGAGESGLNPWRWESDVVPTVAQYRAWTPAQLDTHGYGLYQFTKPTKYIDSAYAQALPTYGPNFADQTGSQTDGAAQCSYMIHTIPDDWLAGNYSYYDAMFRPKGIDINDFYWMTFTDFRDGTGGYNLDQMTGAFELRFERPGLGAADSYPHRCDEARYWLAYIQGHPPAGDLGVPEMWYYLKKKKYRLFRK